MQCNILQAVFYEGFFFLTYLFSFLVTLLSCWKHRSNMNFLHFQKHKYFALPCLLLPPVVLQSLSIHIQQTFQQCIAIHSKESRNLDHIYSNWVSTFLKTRKSMFFHTRSNCRKGKKYLGFSVFICAFPPAPSLLFRSFEVKRYACFRIKNSNFVLRTKCVTDHFSN